jgi:ankyrin repeat protein
LPAFLPACPFQTGATAIMLAAAEGQLATVKMLVAAGANLNVRDLKVRPQRA